jgi:hypothetical protein
MRLGSEMDYGVRLGLFEQALHQVCVANIADESITGVARNRSPIFQITGVGELIRIDD